MLYGAWSPKQIVSSSAASAASAELRANMASSHCASATSMSSGWAAMALPSSDPSYMARLAPSPEGGIKWAASPRSVTPGTRSQR